ncbi:TolB family protein, partial [Paraconexibacter sp.]|uniref:TolB family protein n=1 Tax=Paraconexibacter sp. TaxID=2949640 RepID=UPI003568A7DE
MSAFAASLPVRTAALSTDAEGRTPDAASGNPTISRLGTITAFDTAATTFGPGSANGKIRDVVTVNLATGARTLVSDPGVGLPAANGPSTSPALSRDGSTVAFVSTASNLVAGDTNRAADVFVRDAAGTLTRVSVTSLGQEANGDSGPPAISGDGRFVVFSSRASNLVPNDTNRTEDVFVHDRRTGTTSLVSVTPKGTSGSGRSSTPAISDDGAVVSFESLARDLVSGDTNGVADVFVRNI